MSNREKTAGETANASAAGAAKFTGTGYIVRIGIDPEGNYWLADDGKDMLSRELVNQDGTHEIVPDICRCLFSSPFEALHAAFNARNNQYLMNMFPKVVAVRIEATVVKEVRYV
jgi:hypothetical protein